MKKIDTNLLYAICQNIPDAVCMVDTDWNILAWNRGAEKVFGYAEDEVVGRNITFLMPQEIAQAEIAHCAGELQAKGIMTEYETVRIRKDGQTIPIELTAVLLRTGGSVAGYAAIMRDTSERKRTEEALKLMQFSVEHASACIYLIGRDARFLYVNQQTCSTLGYTREEMLARSVGDIDPDFPRSVWDDHWEQLRREGNLQFETRHRRKDGSLVPIELSLNFLPFKGMEYNVAFGLDISRRKRTEQELTRVSRRNELILESAAEGIFGIDGRGEHNFLNSAGRNMLGYQADELLGRKSHFLWHHSRPDGSPYPEEECTIYRTLRDGVARHVEDEVFWRKDGLPVPVEYETTPIREEGVIVGAVVTFREIAERRQAERRLRESEERYRSIVETSADWIWELDLRGTMLFNNPAVERILGYTPGDLAGKNNYTFMYEEDLGKAKVIFEKAIRERTGWTGHLLRWKHKDGSLRFIESNAVALFDERGALVGFRGSDRDVTEIRRAQEKLRKAYDDLEIKVQERTRELARTNEELRMEVTERRRAVDLLRRSKELSDALNELNTVIHSTLDLDEIMQRVVTEATRAAKLDAGMIGVFENGVFRVRYLYNMPEAFTSMKLTRNELRAIRLAARSRDVLAFNDAVNDTRLNRAFVRAVGIRSLLVAPLLIKGGMAGALAFYALDHAVVFETEHLDFARKLAASVSLALENANLYREIRASEQKLNAVLNTIPDMAWMKDRDGRFILVNEAFAQTSGRSVPDLIGKNDFEVWPRDLAGKYNDDDRQVMRTGKRKGVEEQLVAADGSTRWIETIKTPVRGETGAVIGTVGIARDITRRRKLEEEIRHMAQHDSLTGLPNRRLFLDILKVELAQARRHRSKCAILFIDLDRFKEVNDTLGHNFGDLLLKQVSARLTSAVRESDTVARIGGDEFNVVLSDITRPDDVGDIALKIVKSFREPFVLAPHALHLTTSIGISIYPDDSKETESLLRYADMAMYDAKENGRNTFRFYDPSINIRSVERMKFENWLRQAVKRGELSLLYQPQIEISSMKMHVAEALVRWNHPERGVLAPGEFIPLAEETGFISDIDEWVLRHVCMQARSWKDAGLDSFCLTVNLSARQFQRTELVPVIAGILAETGMPPGCLDIEITESVAMRDVEQSARQLRELRHMGVHITVDDFGTGYSSLNYLKKLPIERIKIDKSFIRDITTDADDRTIITAVTSMAHKMGIRTVAEGVETQDQLAFLRETGCDEAQGFLFSRPLPPERFQELAAGK